jgi:dTDP-4-amino-4,6-dideoxygalactose transaminase
MARPPLFELEAAPRGQRRPVDPADEVAASERDILFSEPCIGEEEISAVVDCMRSGWLTSGPRVHQFEADFASYVGAKEAIAVNSCTAALHLALEALGVGRGDEVITSTMTFTATAAVIEHLGARPVLVDCETATLNIDPEQVDAAITPRTKAIVPVHFAGEPCDMDALEEISQKKSVPLVEDAAHALPATHRGRKVGTMGAATCFSFYVTKTITTGEGGMVTTENRELAERMRLMRLHGMSRDAWKRYAKGGSWMYEVMDAGFKVNLTDLAAAIGIEQLKRSDDFQARRRRIVQIYDDAFRGVPGLQPPESRDPEAHAWHLYVLRIVPSMLRIDRDRFIQEMTARNIGSSVHFIPLHVHPHYRDTYGYKREDFPRAASAFERVISLPLHPKMSDEDAGEVVRVVRGLAEAYQR